MESELIGACIIGQSGGPTAVINSSAYGVIRSALDSPYITKVLGAAHGIVGILNDVLYDMGQEDPEELELLMTTPASELGSCRYRIADFEKDDTDYKRILEVFKKYNVRYFFYNGGNDSMDTCDKIDRYFKKIGYKCNVIGVPKTIDNDLVGTDHCPGFPSSAKYIATSICEVYKDAKVYKNGSIIIMEIMGRHAGWLAASSVLAGIAGCPPDLIYLPEVDFDMEDFLNKVSRIFTENKSCIVAVSEGIHYADGTLVTEASKAENDGFGHIQLGGLASILADKVKKRLNVKVRGIELSLLQRCCSHTASETDINEAFLAGKAAVDAAVSGKSGYMVAFEREYIDVKYTCKTTLFPLEKVANYEKKIPRSWINEEGDGVTQEFLDYVLPLVVGEPKRKFENGMPRYAKLKKILVK